MTLVSACYKNSVTNCEPIYPPSDSIHESRSFMAEDDRSYDRKIAFKDRLVRVAKSSRSHSYPHLPLARIINCHIGSVLKGVIYLHHYHRVSHCPTSRVPVCNKHVLAADELFNPR